MPVINKYPSKLFPFIESYIKYFLKDMAVIKCPYNPLLTAMLNMLMIEQEQIQWKASILYSNLKKLSMNFSVPMRLSLPSLQYNTRYCTFH